jgi:hypothetical protein
MTAADEKLYRAIGKELIACAPEGVRPVLVYAEIGENVHGSGLFYPMTAKKKLAFKFGSTGLENVLMKLWSSQKTRPKDRWRAVAYSVEEDNAFTVDFVYPDAFDEEASSIERRQRFVEKKFGKLAKKIDYSAPELDLDV